MLRLISSSLALALAFAILASDIIQRTEDRRIQCELLKSLNGRNQGQWSNMNGTDCAESQAAELWPDGAIPAVHCINFDEAVADEACFICGTIGQFYQTYLPFPSEPASNVFAATEHSCELPLHIGVCSDKENNGLYMCDREDDMADGLCFGTIDEYLSQQLQNP